jgi:hypothetical protein
MMVFIITTNAYEDYSADYAFSTLEKAEEFLKKIGGQYREIDTLILDDTSDNRFAQEQFIEYCTFDYKVNCFKPNYGSPEPHMRGLVSASTHKIVNGKVEKI